MDVDIHAVDEANDEYPSNTCGHELRISTKAFDAIDWPMRELVIQAKTRTEKGNEKSVVHRLTLVLKPRDIDRIIEEAEKRDLLPRLTELRKQVD